MVGVSRRKPLKGTKKYASREKVDTQENITYYRPCKKNMFKEGEVSSSPSAPKDFHSWPQVTGCSQGSTKTSKHLTGKERKSGKRKIRRRENPQIFQQESLDFHIRKWLQAFFWRSLHLDASLTSTLRLKNHTFYQVTYIFPSDSKVILYMRMLSSKDMKWPAQVYTARQRQNLPSAS